MENPFKGGAPKITAPWWPEGEFREFCESVMEQVYRPRARWMRKPHLGEFFWYIEASSGGIVSLER